MKNEIYIPIIGLIVGELMILSNNPLYGLGIHVINLLTITFIIIFNSLEIRTKNILYGITLLVLLQMIYLSLPHLFTIPILQYLLTYAIMLIPMYYIIKDKTIISDLGTYSRLIVVLLIGILVEMFQIVLGPISSDITYINGEFITVYLIISIVITLMILDTKYWHRRSSDILGMCSNSLLPVFIMIIISKMLAM